MTFCGAKAFRRFKGRRRSTSLAIAFALAFACSGCERGASPSQRAAQRDAEAQKLEQLLQRYLDGTLHEARQSMEEAVAVIEGSPHLDGLARSRSLWIGYARLHRIATRANDSQAAERYWAQVKHWRYRTQAELALAAKEPAPDANEYTPVQSLDYIDNWDMKVNRGRRPRFMTNDGQDQRSP